MAKKDPSIRGMVILPVIQPNRRRRSERIITRNPGCKKQTVETVRNCHDGQDAQKEWSCMHNKIK